MLLWAAPAAAEEGRDPAARGYLDLRATTRVFSSPLFGSSSSGTYRAFASHPLRGGGTLASWYASGFPNYIDDYGLEVSAVPWRGGALSAGAGDLLVGAPEPAGFSTLARDAYPLRGASLGFATDRRQWNLFAGQPKFASRRLDGSIEPEWLAGGNFLSTAGRYHLGGSLTVVEEPYTSGRPARSTLVVGTRAFRSIWPDTLLFADIASTDRGGLGYIVGVERRFTLGSLSGEIYDFSEEFPAAAPLFRPGENGVRLSGNVRPGLAWSAFGSLDLVGQDLRGSRERVRGYAGVGYSPLGLPLTFRLVHHRARETFDSRSIAGLSSASDRTTLSARYGRGAEFLDVSAERVTNDSTGSPDRDQIYAFYRRLLGVDSLIDGSFVLQRSDPDDVGLTAESSVERPLAGSLSWVAGLGLAFLDRGGPEEGEGAVRLGLTHRPTRTGLFLRVEARIPFSIGMPRSELASRTLTVDLGTRFEWFRDLAHQRPASVPRRSRGLIAGRVVLEGKGLGGLTVLVDGRRAVTRRDGSFRVRQVPTGPTTVALDVRSLDPRYAPVGGAVRSLNIVSGRNTVEFVIAPFSYFQGAVVTCRGGELTPLGFAHLVLAGAGYEREVEASRLGSFQFDAVPPGTYELRVRTDPDHEPRRFRVDLTQDVCGELIRVGCPQVRGTDPVGAAPTPHDPIALADAPAASGDVTPGLEDEPF